MNRKTLHAVNGGRLMRYVSCCQEARTMLQLKRGFALFAVVMLCVLGASGVQAQEKATLSIINFDGYSEEEWVKPFEEKYNCEVKITTAGTVEEHFTKVKAAPNEYNIVSIDSGRVKLYQDSGLIQPIDVSKLSNYNKIGEFFREHPYAKTESGQKLHVPIVWGTQTITINTARVPEEKLAPYLSEDGKTVSLDILTAPEFQGEIAFFDESTNVVSIAAIHLGLDDPFHFEEGDWEKVQQRLYEWKSNARTFTTGLDSEFGVLTGEDAYVVLGGNDALLNLRLEEAGMRENFTQYAMTEGTISWIDGWVITAPTEGRSLELAHAYIDYMIGDQGQEQLARLVGFGIVNPAGSGGFNPVVLDSAWWYAEDIGEFPAPLYIMVPEEDPGKRVELWNRVKAMP
ncbi:extracellular solute-binding protein [candidate division KSB3 bacterium]|uniref:Extracellular solute-binding protein n=1 Tax=candidate division KSB3 bacterium TaxID=2044937 RepID=A0A9D5JVN4_9BACT|nr:extracellular solute-binding protein [candidate division KSB3 bacterium]MBD3324771.1 extracellular solute-binding protein [candidate division KSB3 bacterium]